MAEDLETLEESLRQYELQLQQVTEALINTDGSSEELNSLRDNLNELIMLTKENLESMKLEASKDPLDEEYALFKAELEIEDTNENEESFTEENIQDELNCLIGTKCQAPFYEQWSETTSSSYHNALIMSIDSSSSLDNVQVKVMFVNPTCKEMLPCQYFLDGECKFSDENCHFSHGYVVNFSDIREYKEPNFDSLKENASILVKDTDSLWKRAIISALMLEENQCFVKFESGQRQEKVVDIKDTLPLGEGEVVNSEITPRAKRKKIDDADFEERQSAMVEKCLSKPPPPTKLGEWEQYTNSIGSKLMASMGYVVGTGLGKHGEGRVEPVTAVVLPPGKSLDHCMALREAAGGDPNLFSVDKLQKKLRKRVLAKKPKGKQQPKKSNNLFSFINESLSNSLPSSKESKPEFEDNLKQSSTQALNVQELLITEDIQKKNYELTVLRERLSRQQANSVGRNELKRKVRLAENELNGMQTKLKNVNKEQTYRQTMKQLTEF